MRVTQDEVAHYDFHTCGATFEESLSASPERQLRWHGDAACGGREGQRSARLTSSSRLETAPGGAVLDQASEGLSLELWLLPTMQRSAGPSSTLLALSFPSEALSAEAQGSIRLLLSSEGCLQLALSLPRLGEGSSTTAVLEGGSDCQVMPHIYQSASRLTHVAIAIGARQSARGLPHVSFFVDGDAVLDSELESYPHTRVREGLVALGVELAANATAKTLRCSAMHSWLAAAPCASASSERATLQLGGSSAGSRADSAGDNGQPVGAPWSGEVFMAGLYRRPLTPSEVRSNFAAGLRAPAPVRDALGIPPTPAEQAGFGLHRLPSRPTGVSPATYRSLDRHGVRSVALHAPLMLQLMMPLLLLVALYGICLVGTLCCSRGGKRPVRHEKDHTPPTPPRPDEVMVDMRRFPPLASNGGLSVIYSPGVTSMYPSPLRRAGFHYSTSWGDLSRNSLEEEQGEDCPAPMHLPAPRLTVSV